MLLLIKYRVIRYLSAALSLIKDFKPFIRCSYTSLPTSFKACKSLRGKTPTENFNWKTELIIYCTFILIACLSPKHFSLLTWKNMPHHTFSLILI